MGIKTRLTPVAGIESVEGQSKLRGFVSKIETGNTKGEDAIEVEDCDIEVEDDEANGEITTGRGQALECVGGSL